MDLIPFSMINAYAYCPKRFYIEYILGDFEESSDTVEGKIKHKIADSGKTFKKQGKRTRVYIASEKYGIHGFLDVLEESDSISVVEYKKGKYGDWFNDKVQLCAQVIAYEDETSLKVDHAYIYYIASRKKVEIDCNEELRKRTITIVKNMIELAISEKVPKVKASKKCKKCSLFHICMPTSPGKPFFPVQVRKQKGGSLVITNQGSYVGVENGRIMVSISNEKRSIRMNEIGDVQLYGNSVISTAAVKRLSESNKYLHLMTFYGDYVGTFFPKTGRNVVLRLSQYETYNDDIKKVQIASKFIEGKIKNMSVLLKRRKENSHEIEDNIKSIELFSRKIKKAKNIEEIMGIEGTASAIYFDSIKHFVPKEFEFKKRNRRPPLDPVNAMLSFGYAILLTKIISALEIVGLDPYIGFLHSQKYGKPSLALDVMEEFRSVIVDAVVLTLVNKKMVLPKDFLKYSNGVFLKSKAKKVLISALDKRFSTTVMHPYVGYKMVYQRVIEAQCRILAKTITGEIESYIPFKRRV